MRKPAAALGLLLLLWALAMPALARDPLNKAEVDQLRDVAQEPGKRIPLYVKFIKARAVALEELRNDPRFDADRGSRVHDLLEDIDSLAQEMGDNISTYAHQRLDLRKPLKDVMAMADELQPKLRAMKESSTGEQARIYGFALDNAIDALQGNREDAQQIMQEQEEAFKNAKKK